MYIALHGKIVMQARRTIDAGVSVYLSCSPVASSLAQPRHHLSSSFDIIEGRSEPRRNRTTSSNTDYKPAAREPDSIDTAPIQELAVEEEEKSSFEAFLGVVIISRRVTSPFRFVPSKTPNLPSLHMPMTSMARRRLRTFASLLWLVLILKPSHAWLPPFLSTVVSRPPTLEPTPSMDDPKKQQRTPQDIAEDKARSRHNNDVFNALFVPADECLQPVPLLNAPPRPSDVAPGCLLRMGPNGASASDAFLDGDGMIHSITFPPNGQTPQYSCRYVDTAGRQLEAATNKQFYGTLGAAPQGWSLLGNLLKNMINFRTIQGLKDSCNTAIAQHGSTILALMEQGLPSQIRFGQDSTMTTVQAKTTLQGAIPNNDVLSGGQLSAHGRTCPRTGDRIHVSYCSSSKPYARVDIFGLERDTKPGAQQGWNLKRTIPLDDISVPVMIHDCAITDNYAIVLDFPLTVRPERMIRNEFPVEYEPEHGGRIGLVHRFDTSRPTQWFAVEPSVVLHTMNAYEDDHGRVVLQALRSVPRSDESYLTQYATGFLYEWVMDTATGVVREQVLNDNELSEFPIIDDRYTGTNTKYGYAVTVGSIGGPLHVNRNPQVGITLDGVAKFALSDSEKGRVVSRYTLPDGWYGVSEPTVVPKKDSDGCYISIIATQVPSSNSVMKTSRVFLLDGDDLSRPVWEADVPVPMPYGLHSSYVAWENLAP